MRRREVQVGERVGLGLLQHACGAGAASPEHLAGHVVRRTHHGGVPEPERRRGDAGHALPQLPRPRLAAAVPHEVHDAALPGGPLELLGYRSPEPLVGVAGDEPHAGDAAPAHLAQERVCLVKPDFRFGDADDNPYQTRRLGRGRKCIHMRKREELLSSISATTRVVQQ